MYSLNWLPIVNAALQIVRRKGKSASLREERRGEAKIGRFRYNKVSRMDGGTVHEFRERDQGREDYAEVG